MIVLKENPVGIDLEIQSLQKKLYAKINKDIISYGRVYKIEQNEKTILAHYLSGNDYKEVFTNDKKDGIFFFLVDNKLSYKENINKVKVDLVFIVNLTKFFPSINHRADEEFQTFIANHIAYFFDNREYEVTKGLDALSEFKISTDMHPYHILKFRGDVEYQNIKC